MSYHNRGGARDGAGRPTKAPTKLIRIEENLADRIKELTTKLESDYILSKWENIENFLLYNQNLSETNNNLLPSLSEALENKELLELLESIFTKFSPADFIAYWLDIDFTEAIPTSENHLESEDSLSEVTVREVGKDIIGSDSVNKMKADKPEATSQIQFSNYKSSDGHFLTQEQFNILEAVRDRLSQTKKKGLLIEALAGTGKSTMLVEIAKVLKDENLSPMECRFVVFGKKNKQDLTEKLSEINWEKSVQTLNSLGYEILREALGRSHNQFRLNNGKYEKIAQNKGYLSYQSKQGRKIPGTLEVENQNKEIAVKSKADFVDLLDKVRLHCYFIDEINEDNIWHLAGKYGIEISKNRIGEITEAICDVLETGLDDGINKLNIDFLDQSWLLWHEQDMYKHIFKKWSNKLKVIGIDECQDTDLLQIQFIKLIHNSNVNFMIPVGDRYQCQPPGTLVRLGDGQANKVIEDLQVGDVVCTYDRHVSSIVKNGVVTEIQERNYKGYLYSVKADEKITRCTANHKWLVRWTNTDDCVWCVYLMQKGNWFRIGKCKLFYNVDTKKLGYDRTNFGPAAQARQEKADAFWILNIYKCEKTVLIEEQIIAVKFGLPQIVFSSPRHNNQNIWNDVAIENLYNKLHPQIDNAADCLQYFDRDINYPIWSNYNYQKKQGRATLFECATCNLIPDYMAIPVAPDVVKTTKAKRPNAKKDKWVARVADWNPVAVEKEFYQGKVYSLNVEKHHKYIADGLITCNSIYSFRGAMTDGIDVISKKFSCDKMPLTTNWRCGKKHLSLVREIYPSINIKPSPTAPDGEIRIIKEDKFLDIFDEADRSLSFFGICRKNAPLLIFAIRLLTAGYPVRIKDRNLGTRLLNKVKEVVRNEYNINTFLDEVEEWFKSQANSISRLPDKIQEQKMIWLSDYRDCLVALFTRFQPKSLNDWKTEIDKIFDESTTTRKIIDLYTIHSGKGGEGHYTFILYPENMPIEFEKQSKEEKQQEQHMIYVALTRCLARANGGILWLVLGNSTNYPKWLPHNYRKLWSEDDNKLE